MIKKLKQISWYLIYACIVFLTGSCSEESEDESTWKFMNVPDLHNSELFVNVWESAWKDEFTSYDSYRESKIDELGTAFQRLQEKHEVKLLVSPGDCNTGHWYTDDFRRRFRSVPKYQSYSDGQIIREASRLCYSALNEIVFSSGYTDFLMTVGDHELGDNPWNKGSEVVKFLPQFREGFAEQFTMAKSGTGSRFSKPIGNAPARPIGTKYENTSYAVQYRNALFITLDVFRFDGEEQVLGEEGVLIGDVHGEHLLWLEHVLEEAQNVESIDHIIVQSHLPIIYPVRKFASSGMMMEGASSNELLDVMRKYKVDLYLAGEVHLNTVTKDPESNLVQFVGRGVGLTNYSVIEVGERSLKICGYDENDDLLGELEIYKSRKQRIVEGTGMLKPIDPEGIQVHWSFDQLVKPEDFKCSLSNFPERLGASLLDKEDSVPSAYPNEADMGMEYSLFCSKLEKVPGVKGQALRIKKGTKLFVKAIGPMLSDFERTVAFWIRSSANDRRLILNSNSFWKKDGQFFNISMNDGEIEVALRPDVVATAKEVLVNDNQWHHVAVVVPHKKARLEDCQIYVDGERRSLSCQNGATTINTKQANWLSIATQSKRHAIDLKTTMNMADFYGDLDEFSLWTHALDDDEIRQIVNMGMDEVNAIQLEK